MIYVMKMKCDDYDVFYYVSHYIILRLTLWKPHVNIKLK